MDRTHPFISRIREVVRPILNSERQRSVSQLAARDEPEIEDKLRRELSDIASKLGEFLEGERGDDEPEALGVVPGSVRIDLGEIESFSVIAAAHLVDDPETARVEVVVIDGEDHVELDTNERLLKPRGTHYSANFKVRGVAMGAAHLLIAVGNKTATLGVRVGDIEEEEALLDLLAFDRKQYSVRADGSRAANVEVRVAAQLQEAVGDRRVALSLGGAKGISEAVLLDTPAPALREDGNGVWLGQARLVGGRGGSGLTGQLNANYGDMSVSARVRITGAETKIGDELAFQIEYLPHIEARKRRYSWDLENDPQVLNILTEHPSVRSFYKDSLSESSVIRLTAELQTVTREIAASAVAYRRVEEEDWPQDTRPETIMAEYEQVLERALRHLYSG